MRLETSRFGTFDIEKDDIITMKPGLYGFPQYTKYVILEYEAKSPFCWFQSVDNPNLAFVLTDPFLFAPNYHLDLSEEDCETLCINKESKIKVFSIVTVPGNYKDMTINLLAPIVINASEKLGKQIILPDETLPVRYPIFR